MHQQPQFERVPTNELDSPLEAVVDGGGFVYFAYVLIDPALNQAFLIVMPEQVNGKTGSKVDLMRLDVYWNRNTLLGQLACVLNSLQINAHCF